MLLMIMIIILSIFAWFLCFVLVLSAIAPFTILWQTDVWLQFIYLILRWRNQKILTQTQKQLSLSYLLNYSSNWYENVRVFLWLCDSFKGTFFTEHLQASACEKLSFSNASALTLIWVWPPTPPLFVPYPFTILWQTEIFHSSLST